jgi:hypothetical protein
LVLGWSSRRCAEACRKNDIGGIIAALSPSQEEQGRIAGVAREGDFLTARAHAAERRHDMSLDEPPPSSRRCQSKPRPWRILPFGRRKRTIKERD